MKNNCEIKKICFIYPAFPPENFGGGISTAIGEIIECFKGKKEKVLIIGRSLSNKKITIEKIDTNIELHRIPTEPNRFIKILNKITNNYFKMIIYSIYIAIYLKKQNKIEKIDIVEAADWGGEIFASSKIPFRINVPYIVRIYTPGFVSETFNKSNKSYLGSIAKRMEKSVLNDKRNIIITPTNKIVKLLENNGIHKRKYFYSFINPVDTSNTYKYRKTDKVKFFFAARFEERKGIECIFKAIRELLDRGYSEFEFYLYGADTFKENKSTKDLLIKKYKLENELNRTIFIKGEVQRDILLQDMKKYNVYVSASIFELVGFSVTEAILNGNILVGTRVGALYQVLKDKKEALFFEPNHFEELTDIMENILNCKYDLEKISKAAQSKFKKYSNYNTNYKRIMETLNRAIKGELQHE